MTYLEAINNVLRELRETTVTDLSADYTQLIGQYVNRAKGEVEAAFDWSSLKTDVTFSTAAGTASYLLSGTNEDSRLAKNHRGAVQVFNMSQSGSRLAQRNREWIRSYQAASPPNAMPYTFAAERSNSGLTLVFSPKPDAIYSIQATVVIPQATLDTAGTTITAPADPIWRLALAYAARERTGGLGDDANRLENDALESLEDYKQLELDSAASGCFYAD